MTETPQGDPAQPTPPVPPYGQQYPAPGQAYPQQNPQQPYPGQPYPGQPASLQYGAPTGPSKTNALAITALVVGVVGLMLCWVPFLGLIIGIAALVLGFIGMKKSTELGGKGLAIGGIATGGLTLLIGLIVTVATIFFVNAVDDNIDDWDELNERIQEDLENMDTEG